MADPNKSIFLDLEIDVDEMIGNPDNFAKRVYEEADRLVNILSSKTSLKGAHSEVEHSAKLDAVAKTRVDAIARQLTEEIDECGEELPLHELYHFMEAMKKISKSVELEFYTRARNEMILNSPNMVDKKMAHEQYKRLRESFEAFRTLQKLLNDKVYSPLEAKSGNYGDDSGTSYPTYRYDGQVYNNYRAIARLLKLDPDQFKSHMDFSDYLTLNNVPDVEIIQVTL